MARRPSPLVLVGPLVTWSCLASAAFGAHVWIVDASGAGDFTSVQAAADAAATGDVLCIRAGSYGGAVLSKRLTLVGDPAGQALPALTSVDVAGAPAVNVSRLAIARMRIIGTGERTTVERCDIGPGAPWSTPFFAWSAFVADAAGDLVLDNCTIRGGVDGSGSGYAGFVARASDVAIVACEVRGGDGAANGTSAGRGGDAVHLWGGSRAWIAASDLRGGHGQDGSAGSPGVGGDALRIGEGAAAAWADVRGGSTDELHAGLANPGASGPLDGRALRVMHACGSAPPPTYGGVTVLGAVDACAVPHATPAPYLVLSQASGPGSPASARLHGAAGAAGVVALAFAPAQVELPTVLGAPLGLDPQALLVLHPLLLAGLDTPASLPLVQPASASLAGFVVHAQGFEVTPFGFLHATAPAAWVLSF